MFNRLEIDGDSGTDEPPPVAFFGLLIPVHEPIVPEPLQASLLAEVVRQYSIDKLYVRWPVPRPQDGWDFYVLPLLPGFSECIEFIQLRIIRGPYPYPIGQVVHDVLKISCLTSGLCNGHAHVKAPFVHAYGVVIGDTEGGGDVERFKVMGFGQHNVTEALGCFVVKGLKGARKGNSSEELFNCLRSHNVHHNVRPIREIEFRHERTAGVTP